MRALILGSSGIIGQHMRLCVPEDVEPVWHRLKDDPLYAQADLTAELDDLLGFMEPDVIVNLAGESSPDVVENVPDDFECINVRVPEQLAKWATRQNAHYVHISTQGVFGGNSPPYGADSELRPINAYGCQKAEAETVVRAYRNWTILRPTFVLGVRPFPLVGRTNPVEQILSGQPRQVDDRYFSVLFARDAARLIWAFATKPPTERAIHLGNPERLSRLKVALLLGAQPESVCHSWFEGIAPRPLDTTYKDTLWLSSINDGIQGCLADWQGLQKLDLRQRAKELALFLEISEEAAFGKLACGFVNLHNEVSADFKRFNPMTDDDLLDWYRFTDSYLWELSSYHCDPGFNYSGMCDGIVQRLKGLRSKRVLCLGDGIGDLTLALAGAGLEAVYHDLAGSRTAEFARFRFSLYHPKPIEACNTQAWNPDPIMVRSYDAVISLDFLEHVTDVPHWTRAIEQVLTPGGWAFFQNAFGLGSGRNGSIPCHLARNDRFEKDWTPLLDQLNFSQSGTSNWWQKRDVGVVHGY